MEDDDRPSNIYPVRVYIDGDLGCAEAFSVLLSLPNAKDAADFASFIWEVCTDLWHQKPKKIDYGYHRDHSGLYSQLPTFLNFSEYLLDEEKVKEFIKRWVLYIQHRRPEINGRNWNDNLVDAIEIEENRIMRSWREPYGEGRYVDKWNS